MTVAFNSTYRSMQRGVGYSIPEIMLGKRKGQDTSGSKTAKRVRDAAWYQRLVDYCTNRRATYTPFWDLVEKNYRHTKLEQDVSDEMLLDEIFPGRVYSIVHTTEAMVFNNRPKFFLRGASNAVQQGAVPVLEDMLNCEWQQDLAISDEVRMAVRDCIKTGTGVCLTTYEAEFDPEAQEEAAEERRDMKVSDPALAQLDAAYEAQIAAALAPGRSPETTETYQQDSRILHERICTVRISPKNFLIDPDCTGPHNAKWMGDASIVDLEALRADPTLSNTSDIGPTSREFIRDRFGMPTDRYESPYESVVVYRIFEKLPSGDWRFVIFAHGSDKFLAEKIHPYWIGCPYALLQWNQDGSSIYCQSDILPVFSQILGERILLTKVIDAYAREAEDTIFYDAAAGISREELNAERDPGSARYVKVTTSGKSIQQSFFSPPKSPKSPDALNLLGILERSIQISTGIGPNQLSQAMKSGTTATEASEAASFARARGSHKFSAVENFIAQIAYHRLGLMAQFYDAARVAQSAGAEYAESWASLAWTKSDVQHNLHVYVSPGSMKPENDETRVSQLVSFLGVVSQDPVMAVSVNKVEMMKRIFKGLGFHQGDPILLETDAQKIALASSLMHAVQLQGGMTGPESMGGPPAPMAETPGELAQNTQNEPLG